MKFSAIMGMILSFCMFCPPEPSYTAASLTSPPLEYIDGVPCLWYGHSRQRGIIVYLHCNGVDLGQIRNLAFTMGRQTQHSVLAVEYPGYGIHQGRPTPQSCVRTGNRVLSYLKRRHPSLPIVLVGRSIGTGVACQLAKEGNYKAVILISPFSSVEQMAKRMVGGLIASAVASGVFDSEAALSKVKTPTLLFHGDSDTLIPADHSSILREASASPYCLHTVLQGSTHDDLDWPAIFTGINSFLSRL